MEAAQLIVKGLDLSLYLIVLEFQLLDLVV